MVETTVVRTIRVKGTSEGIDKLTSDLGKLAGAQENVAVVSEESARRSLSVEQAWKKQTMQVDESARSQARFAREARTADAALRQGLVTPEQHAQRMEVLTQRYGQASVASKAFAAATSGVSGQLIALSAGAGPVGTFLAALGPWGMAASVGLGAVSAVFNRISEGAERIGDKSIELRKFADVSGLTVTQIKALTVEGGKLGIGSEELASSIEKFSVGMAEARKGTGALFGQIRSINPQLAIELAQTRGTAQAWDVLARALRGATDEARRNALARAAFGRGGIETGLVAERTDIAGGIDVQADKIAKASGLTKEWVNETARLRAENIQLEKSINNTMDAAYALPVLRRQNEFLRVQKDITDELLKSGTRGPSVGKGAGLPELVTRGPGDSASFNEAIAAAGKAQREGQEAGKAFKLDPETLAGWQQLDEAMGAVVVNSQKAANALTEIQNAALRAANTERERIGILGAAATDQERLNLRTLELNALLINNKISQEDYNRALKAATFLADDQLRSLRNQGELLRASSDEERGRIRAAQEYQRIVETTNDVTKASAVASQMQANARSEQLAREEAEADRATVARNEARVRAADAEIEAANAVQRMMFEAQRRFDAMYEKFKFLPFQLHDAMGQLESSALFESKQGGKSQFNPAGYTSSTAAARQFTGVYMGIYGMGGFDPETGAPNQKGMEFLFSKALAAAGGDFGATVGTLLSGGILTQGAVGAPPQVDTQRLDLINRGIALLSTDQQIAATQNLLGQLSAAPASLQTSELIKQLNDSLAQLTRATDENTSATSAMTDVLSPFYSSDPRRTYLGFRAFAGGGIMTDQGAMPLDSGIATSRQVAVFGEGATPEAYVPVPTGRIPVELKGPAANSNQRQRPISVNILVQGNADAGTVAALKATAFQQAQAMRRVTG